MKTLIFFLALTLIVGCTDYNKEWKTAYNSFLQGSHELRKMRSSQIEGGWQAWFILGIGSAHSEDPKTQVTFAWKESVRGTYVISSVPIEHIRVKIDNSIKTPSIEFVRDKWYDRTVFGERPDIDEMYGYIHRLPEVSVVIISCRDDQWIQDIRLPLQ